VQDGDIMVSTTERCQSVQWYDCLSTAAHPRPPSVLFCPQHFLSSGGKTKK
jgi:hypothetical protein